MRKVLSGLKIVLLFSSILVSTVNFHIVEVKAPTGYPVHNLDTGLNYTTIQEAIDAPETSDGHTIFIESGTYYEHIVVNKTLSIVGDSVDTTTIDGNYTGHAINIISDNVSISRFTVQNSGNIHMPNLDAGICLNGTTGCNISHNHAINNGFAAISLLHSNWNTITYNNLDSAGWGGIHLLSSSHNTISGNNITDKYGGINGHVSSNYNSITENTISNCTYGSFYHAATYNNICKNNISTIAVEGIWLQDQVNYNVVAENNLINNNVAIRLQGPNYNNTLSRNFITGAEYGIKIENYASYTRIADNVIVNNRAGNDSWSAGVRLDSGAYTQIDSNIIINNNYGVLLYSSSPRVSVCRNNITSNEFGLRVASGGSSYLEMSDNIVTNNLGYGIGLTGFGGTSNHITISGNLIMNNSEGIALGQYSNYNTIIHNQISQNGYGFYIEYSTQNMIWENNILDNDQQVYVWTGSTNTWDTSYPSGGNYWSDYTGVDADHDGIGDSPHVIDENNTDNYPLMGVFSSFNISLEACVDVISNSTIEGFGYFESNSTIRMYVSNTTSDQTFGFCRVKIPHTLMNDTVPITVFVNGTEPYYANYTLYDNGENRWIYFEYEHSTLEIVIVPEFHSLIILPLFMIATILVVIVHRKRKLSQT